MSRTVFRNTRVAIGFFLAVLISCLLVPALWAEGGPPGIASSWASPGIEAEPPPAHSTRVVRPAALNIFGPSGFLGTVPSPGFQAEVSLAGHAGTVLVGTNDLRFDALGGYMRSTDASNTYVDGTPFPFPVGWTGNGDPAMAVWDNAGAPVFYWAQLATSPAAQPQVVLFRSFDGGVTWDGPLAIPPTAIPAEAPDRHCIAVDPETGRLFMAWTHFGTPFGIRVIYSDDAATGSPPTWSAPALVGTRPQDGQATSLAVDPNSDDVYLGWMTFWGGPPDRGVAIVKSTTNGTTWGSPVDVAPLFNHHIAPYGFDRFLWSFSGSSLAISEVTGTVAMVYAASANGTPTADFGDIFFRRSTDGGATWSAATPLNVFPGVDRAQCFPAVATSRTGRIDVTWYDQAAGSGRSDLTDMMYCYSDDDGVTWSSPIPITPAPMHCESGNDFGYPHQGDYNDVTADDGPGVTADAYAGFAGFTRPGPFTTGADPFGFRAEGVQYAPVRVGGIGIFDTGCGSDDGLLEANESADLTIPLTNIGRVGLAGISATLSTSTPDVVITAPLEIYPALASGATNLSTSPFSLTLGPNFQCGRDITLRLDVTATGVAPTYREFTLPTGVVVSSSVLLSQNFDGVVAPALPAGWVAQNLASTLNNWVTTAAGAFSVPNAAFIPISPGVSFGRLAGPVVPVPGGTDYIEVTFKTANVLPQFDSRYAPDGASLEYQLNGAGGSHFASGDATEIDYPYTHNIQRSSGGGAGDRSGWSGSSAGYQSVRFRIPDMSGQTFTPRFDYSTSGAGVGGVGWWVDDVTVTAYTLGCGSCVPTPALVQRFIASVVGHVVELEWRSDAVGDVDAWIVYRAREGDNPFERITPEPIAMGSGGTFSFRDPDAPEGRIVYRLVAVGEGGSERIIDSATIEVRVTPGVFEVAFAGANPVHDHTALRCSLPNAGPLRVQVFSVTGQLARTLADGTFGAGIHRIEFDRMDDSGRRLPPGVYLIRSTAEGTSRTLRTVLVD